MGSENGDRRRGKEWKRRGEFASLTLEWIAALVDPGLIWQECSSSKYTSTDRSDI